MNFVGTLALVIWSVVGVFFWIPLLTRTVAVYCFVVTAAAITGQRTHGLAKMLREATVFYAQGFRRIIESFDDDDPGTPREPLNVPRVVLECAWALFFWACVVTAAWGYWHAVTNSFSQSPDQARNTSAMLTSAAFNKSKPNATPSPGPEPNHVFYLVKIRNATNKDVTYAIADKGENWGRPAYAPPGTTLRWTCTHSQTRIRVEFVNNPAVRVRFEVRHLIVEESPLETDWRNTPETMIEERELGQPVVVTNPIRESSGPGL
jgi:hypothetical protein